MGRFCGSAVCARERLWTEKPSRLPAPTSPTSAHARIPFLTSKKRRCEAPGGKNFYVTTSFPISDVTCASSSAWDAPFLRNGDATPRRGGFLPPLDPYLYIRLCIIGAGRGEFPQVFAFPPPAAASKRKPPPSREKGAHKCAPFLGRCAWGFLCLPLVHNQARTGLS